MLAAFQGVVVDLELQAGDARVVIHAGSLPAGDDTAWTSRDADVVLLRHGETTYNAAGLLNGDPTVDVPLTRRRASHSAGRSGRVLAAIAWAAFVVTPCAATRQSLEEMVPGARAGGRRPDLGDIRLGVLESQPRDAYRDVAQTHGVDEAPEGGESRLHAVERYARGLRRLAEETPHPALVVTHDQPIRYLLNVLAGDDPILGPALPVPNADAVPVHGGDARPRAPDASTACSGNVSRMAARSSADLAARRRPHPHARPRPSHRDRGRDRATGTIVAVGSDAEVRAACDARDRGDRPRPARRWCPGLTDSHIHPFLGSDGALGADLTGVTTLDGVLDALRGRARALRRRRLGARLRAGVRGVPRRRHRRPR